jgi:hypothetical protein
VSVVPFGDSILPGEPNPELVAELERLLSAARSGDLRALAYATVREGNALGTGWRGSDGTRNSVGMSIMLLHHRYSASVIEDAR